NQCYCGTADEFSEAVASDQCGTTYPTLCTGDATSACGGVGAVSIYQITGDVPPAPVPAPAPPTTYSLSGCFTDSKDNRIMGNKMTGEVMSAEVSWC
ncbi:unnamed protein product, partial [Laminaria digitata]